MIGLAQGLNNRLPHGHIRFHAFPLLGDIGNEHIVNTAISLRIGIVSVIIHPAHTAVFPHNPVFHIVPAVIAGLTDLVVDRLAE